MSTWLQLPTRVCGKQQELKMETVLMETVLVMTAHKDADIYVCTHN